MHSWNAHNSFKGSIAKPHSGKGFYNHSEAREEIIDLPRSATLMLQRDRHFAETLYNDLETFSSKFCVAAELEALERVVMRTDTGSLNGMALANAREELQRLLDFYFPVDAIGNFAFL